MSTDIVYMVSHGFAARMVMQTNLLGKLVDAEKQVAVIAPDKDDENLKSYCHKHGVDLYEFNPINDFWSAQYRMGRTYLLEDIKANPALWEKHIYAARYVKSKNPWTHLRPRLWLLIYYLKRWFPILKTWYQSREEKHLESEAAVKLLKRIQPKVVVSTYPVSFVEAMLLKAGGQLGVRKVIHLLSWDNISCKGHFPQLADEYLVWGPIMKEECIEYYQIPEETIHVCGVPHFDLHRNNKDQQGHRAFIQALELNPDLPYLFFGMSAPRFSPFEIEVVEWLAHKLEENVFGSVLQLVVRPHPQNIQGDMADEKWLPRLDALKSGRVGIDYPDLAKSKMPWSMKMHDMDRLSKILCGATISLNSGSTLCVESLVAEVPVIVTGFDADKKLDYWYSIKRVMDYPHLKKLLQTKGVERANSFVELTELIQMYLNNKDRNKAIRMRALDRECGNIQNATQAVCDRLIGLC